MPKITISLDKDVHGNAAYYFEKAKKAKKKLEGAMQALEDTKKKLAKLEKKGPEQVESKFRKINVKREWYEKFRWFRSSEGFLVIGGRDATTNEILIKKHTDNNDIVFHTDMAGSPFYVIKSEGGEIGEETLQEVCNATASFSRAWKMGLGATSVFHVKPEQVTKEAQSGEYLPKGAFMIRGKTNYMTPKMEIAVGVFEGKIMCGALASIKKHCSDYLIVSQGEAKPSEAAKLIAKALNHHDLDEIIRALPTGGCKIAKPQN